MTQFPPSFAITFSREDFNRFVTVSMAVGMVLGAVFMLLAIGTDIFNAAL